MSEYCDMHIHSNYSVDGELPIPRILEKIREAGLSAAIITDHNEIEGSIIARDLLQDSGLDTVTGLEISARGPDNLNIHVLIYGYRNVKNLRDAMKFIRTQYEILTKLRIQKLKSEGFNIDWSDVLREQDTVPSLGPTLATAVIKRNRHDDRLSPYIIGARSDNPGYNFYTDYIKSPGPYSVEFREYHVNDSLDLAAELKVPAVFAHPGFSMRRLPDEEKESFVAGLKERGLTGIEVYSSHHTKENTEFFMGLAKKYDLLVTGGSDFHGRKKPEIRIGGLKVPRDCFDGVIEKIGKMH